ncbi:MAG TPA: hypothetical protein VIH57_07925 [Bacteroidales bacterium]
METRAQCEKWVIMPFSVGKKEVVQIDYRLPANVTHCTGIALTVSDLPGFYYPHALGELSLSFNNRLSQPVCLPLKYVPDRFRMDYMVCKLEEPLIGSSRVNGYFRNIVPFTYSLKIYLQCLQYL